MSDRDLMEGSLNDEWAEEDGGLVSGVESEGDVRVDNKAGTECSVSKLSNISRWIIGCTLSLLVLLGISVLATSYGNRDSSSGTTSKGSGLQAGSITSNDSDYMKMIEDSLNQKVEAGMCKVFLNTDLTLKDGEIDLLLQNASDNKFSQQIEIVDSSGDMVYKSDVIKPGFKIEYDKVNKTLSKGKHKCDIKLILIDIETNEVVNTVGLPGITIDVI